VSPSKHNQRFFKIKDGLSVISFTSRNLKRSEHEIQLRLPHTHTHEQ